MNKKDIVWEKVEDKWIHNTETIAYYPVKENLIKIVGYNEIIKGDKVLYKNKEYTVVMVSRLGHMGLSDTGELPYTICAHPNELELIQVKEGE